jgi:hypothetical protein
LASQYQDSLEPIMLGKFFPNLGNTDKGGILVDKK